MTQVGRNGEEFEYLAVRVKDRGQEPALGRHRQAAQFVGLAAHAPQVGIETGAVFVAEVEIGQRAAGFDYLGALSA